MKGLAYLSPPTIPEALDLLRTYGRQAKILAGGTDLLVQMQGGELSPRHIIDLKKIPELQGIRPLTDGGLAIGPLTRIADLAAMNGCRGALSILREAAQTIGSVQIRNRATLGGNICRAAPSADMVPALLVLESRIRILNPDQERWISLGEFFVGPGRTVLEPQELLAEIRIPPPPIGGIGVYQKLGPRKAMDLATVGVAVFLQLKEAAFCQDARIALASVAPTPIRAREAEKTLGGNRLTDALIAEAARSASREASPITDLYGPDWYKRQMVGVLAKRALFECLERIRGKHEA